MTQITKLNNPQPSIPNYLRDTWIDKHNKTSISPYNYLRTGILASLEYIILKWRLSIWVNEGISVWDLERKSCPLTRMPGWEKDSIGYHGDDGLVFFESPVGREYGALYSTGDTAGCIASTHIFDGDIYPTVGLISPNECVEMNFGLKPFKFDIDQYAKHAFTDAENQKSKIKKDS
ncbi:unnamed protein product [Rhizophagus irregularis]|nr:unnamed protein product [Rhizophagus irregularis]